MKTIGLIGGMSWESIAIYYRLMNEEVKRQLGGLHSAQLLLWSFDFAEIVSLQASGDWVEATKRMVEAGISLKKAGAEALVICTNTMHKMAADVESGSGLPVLYIADATAKAIKQKNLNTVGLLATRFTMEQDFYKGRLKEQQGINTIVPNDDGRAVVHQVIYEELCKGIIKDSSKDRYLKIIKKLVENGAEGIVLGCTEIGMLIKQEDVEVPLFDTTTLHAESAVGFALDGFKSIETKKSA